MSKRNVTIGLYESDIVRMNGKIFAKSQPTVLDRTIEPGYTDIQLTEILPREMSPVADADGSVSKYNWSVDMNIPRSIGTMDEDAAGHGFKIDFPDYHHWRSVIDMIGGNRAMNSMDKQADPSERRKAVVAALRGEPVDIPYIVYGDDAVERDHVLKNIGLPASGNAPREYMNKLGHSSSEFYVPDRCACVLRIIADNPYDFRISEAEIKDGGDPDKMINALSLPADMPRKHGGKKPAPWTDKSFEVSTSMFADPESGELLLKAYEAGSFCSFDALARYTAAGCVAEQSPTRGKVHRHGHISDEDMRDLQTYAAIWTPEFDKERFDENGKARISGQAAADRLYAVQCERDIEWHTVQIDDRLVKPMDAAGGRCYIVPSESGTYHIGVTDPDLSAAWNGRFDIYIAESSMPLEFYDGITKNDDGTMMNVIRTFGDTYISKDMRDSIAAFNDMDDEVKEQVYTIFSAFDPSMTIEDLEHRDVKECVIVNGLMYGEGKTIFDEMAEYYASDVIGKQADDPSIA